ncbi:MAG: LysM peptidoglycan-binding domain-containing protein [Candidatus Nanopelagicales bacterium]
MTTLAQVSTPTLRLTKRGRFVLILATLTAVSAFVAPSLTSSAKASLDQAGNKSQLIVVSPGETLWTIASRVNPEADPRAVIEEIKNLNVLEGTSVYAGQVLRIPS